jgi:hypothetical protein
MCSIIINATRYCVADMVGPVVPWKPNMTANPRVLISVQRTNSQTRHGRVAREDLRHVPDMQSGGTDFTQDAFEGS